MITVFHVRRQCRFTQKILSELRNNVIDYCLIMKHMSFTSRPLLVAVRLPTEWKTCREVLQGIMRYAHEHGSWALQLIDMKTSSRRLLTDRRYTGFIGTCLDRPSLMSKLAKSDMPIILMDQAPLAGAINCDGRQFGLAAADFFITRGFRNFAFVGNVNSPDWSEERRIAFADRLAESGFSCCDYPKLAPSLRRNSEQEESHLAHWLERLPRPTGLFVVNDARGLQVLNACHASGISVPQDVAVLSCDNDEVICESSSPPLSSFQMTTVEAGYEAARALDDIMRNGPCNEPVIIRYGLQNLVERSSTIPLRNSDIWVDRAMTFIRLNFSQKFTVQRLAKELNISRRSLEMRFRRATGRTLHDELVRARAMAALALLRTSKRSVEDIAQTCGFASASHLGTACKTIFGHCPSTLRTIELPQKALFSCSS